MTGQESDMAVLDEVEQSDVDDEGHCPDRPELEELADPRHDTAAKGGGARVSPRCIGAGGGLRSA